MDRNLLHQYDPSGYDRSYMRMSIESPELRWDGEKWIDIREENSSNKLGIKNNKNNKLNRWKSSIWIYVIISIISLGVLLYILKKFTPWL